MDTTNEMHVGALVKCPACGGEVPIKECVEDNDLNFKCETCRRYDHERYLMYTNTARNLEEKRSGQGFPASNDQDKPVAPGGTRKRNQAVQPEPLG